MDRTMGRWRIRLADAPPPAAMAMRARLFRGGAPDGDRFDAAARHLTIAGPGGLAAYARLWPQDAAGIVRGYSAAFYDLARMAAAFPRALEVGRVAVDDPDPDLPRLMLSALARVVEAEGAALLYGCSSFPGTARPAALSRLAGHAAPAWGARRAAPETMPLHGPAARAALPPLLRLYLSLGATVSDHAVIDRDLGTVHVLAALPVAAIPATRARLLMGPLAAA